MRDPLQFANDVSNYHIVPWPVGVRLAFYLPWLDILCGLALIFHRAFAGALAITGALIFIFIGATIWAKIQGINVACGCFGTREQQPDAYLASRNQQFHPGRPDCSLVHAQSWIRAAQIHDS